MNPLNPNNGSGWFQDRSGNLTLLQNNASKFVVSKDGNTTVSGTLAAGATTVTGALTATTIAASVASRYREIPLPLNVWTNGATPPTTGGAASPWLSKDFDADAETAITQVKIPIEAAAASPILRLEWTNESGTLIPDTKKVQWDVVLTAITSGAIDAGTPATHSTVYTQSGTGTDKERLTTDIILTFDDADQPITASDIVILTLNRNVTAEAGDTYLGDACLLHATLLIPSTTI